LIYRVHAQYNSISIPQQLVCQTYIIHCNNYKDKMKIVKTPQNSFQLISLRIPTHVLTNSQLWITHPLSLSGLMCLQPAIAAPLAVPWDSSNFFPLTAPIEFPNVKETEKGLRPPLVLSSCDLFFSLHKYYLPNPNGESVWNLISNKISKFHENPTVNETGIVVLSRQLWVSAGKENATMRGLFILA